jgi:hypothetical protein
MTTDYIFCPLCGATKWITDKTGSAHADKGRLTKHKCSSCKKFSYTNHSALIEHNILVGITQITRYSVVADIDPYRISVFYHANSTQFQDIDCNNVILILNSAVTFNWYKNEELIEKIKKYVLFS